MKEFELNEVLYHLLLHLIHLTNIGVLTVEEYASHWDTQMKGSQVIQLLVQCSDFNEWDRDH